MKQLYEVLIITVILLFVNISFSQDSLKVKQLFKKVELLIEHDRRIVDKKIQITIYNRPKNNPSEICVRTLDADEDFKHWVYIKPDKEIEVSKSECEKIEEQILSIDFNKFVKMDNRMGIHGYRCQLTYGDMLSSISLNAWTPTSRIEERQLQTYLKVSNMILKMAKMEALK